MTFGSFGDSDIQLQLEAPDTELNSAIQDFCWHKDRVYASYKSQQGRGTVVVVYSTTEQQAVFRAVYADCDKV